MFFLDPPPPTIKPAPPRDRNEFVPSQPEVVCYVTHDRPFAEPILATFQSRTGIRIKPVYDTEANKTVGLFNRLMAESSNPICDVFWNNEPARMLLLQKKGILATWENPEGKYFPAGFKDPGRRWYGFAARMRVLIYNTDLVKEEKAPTSVLDLAHPRWKGKAAMANPLFGSTSTHMAILKSQMGTARFRGFLEAMVANEVQVVASNSAVRDAVSDGSASMGLTDTDDALGAIRAGRPVKIVIPDQGEDQTGAVLFPNTVGVILNAPHREAARRLGAYLLSAEVEQELARSHSGQIPLRPGLEPPAWMMGRPPLRMMSYDLTRASDAIDSSAKLIKKLLIR